MIEVIKNGLEDVYARELRLINYYNDSEKF